MSRVSIRAANLRAAHRQLISTSVAQPALRYAALSPKQARLAARMAFRDAWRDYIARTVVAAEYAIAEEQARQQLKVTQDDHEKRVRMLKEAENGSPQA